MIKIIRRDSRLYSDAEVRRHMRQHPHAIYIYWGDIAGVSYWLHIGGH